MNFGLNFLKNLITNPANHQLITSTLCNNNNQIASPLRTIVRFYERRRFIRRYGYRPHYHSKGIFHLFYFKFI